MEKVSYIHKNVNYVPIGEKYQGVPRKKEIYALGNPKWAISNKNIPLKKNFNINFNKKDINKDTTLNLMFLDTEILSFKTNKDDFIMLLDSLINMDFKFSNLFLVIDSKNRNGPISKFNLDYFTDALKKCNILEKNSFIKIEFLQYFEKSDEYKKMLKEMFSFRKLDDIQITKTYKNAFAYYYSLYHSPTQYLVHIDKPKSRRVFYKKNTDNNVDNYILRSVKLMKTYQNVDFVGNLSDSEGFISMDIKDNHHEYGAFFDNKPQISLQCWVADTIKLKKQWPWGAGMYRHQTENALSSMRRIKGYKSLATTSFETNYIKVPLPLVRARKPELKEYLEQRNKIVLNMLE